MATQHPDNASSHPFSGRPFVDTKEEVEEAHYCFAELGCGEFMWDWEGKHIDENVVEKLFEGHAEFYSKHALGKDVFLTYRIPNVWREKGYRLARSFANVIAANDLAEELGFHAPPVFELILPMTTAARELFYLRTKYAEILQAFEVLKPPGPQDAQLIPLIEEPERLLNASALLEEYHSLCTSSPFKKFEFDYVRPFIARSDPALNSGFVAAVLAAKAALSECARFTEKTGVPSHPILGAGSLPFRGGLSPDALDTFFSQYGGLRTATVQSAFRADYSLPEVKKAVARLSDGLRSRAVVFDDDEKKRVAGLLNSFAAEYQLTVGRLAEFIEKVASFVPARRERKLHIGLLAYSRSVGGQHLPRAIPFTAAFYSLGVPPEFVGTGRGMKKAGEAGSFDALLRACPGMAADLKRAGKYLNKKNLEKLAALDSAWRDVGEDVRLAEELLDLEFGPEAEEEFEHSALTEKILREVGDGKSVSADIEAGGILRKSLG